MAKKKARKVKMTTEDLKKLKQGPLRHEKLDPFLTAWARQLFDRVGKHLQPTFEQWEIGFMRDTHPHREMFVFEAIARAFEAYVKEYPRCDQRKVAGLLSGISMGAHFTPETAQTEHLRRIWLPIWQAMIKDTDALLEQVEQSLPEGYENN